MAEEKWELEAIHEQFNIFESLKPSHESFDSSDLKNIEARVAGIKNMHLKMDISPPPISLREISAEIIKHSNENEDIKLSFVVIVIVNDNMDKMPVFIIESGNHKIFIDMNGTVFESWKAYLKLNNLPKCKFCFPVNGQYTVGGRLKIDFASSPTALKETKSMLWRGLAIVVGVTAVAYSFFFYTTPNKHCYSDLLLVLAENFVPGIKKYFRILLPGVTAIQKYRSGRIGTTQFLAELCKILMEVQNKFGDDLELIFKKVRESLSKLYQWIRQKFSDFFESASEESQHQFLAVTSRMDTEINSIDSEVNTLLEASRKSNHQAHGIIDAEAIHSAIDARSGLGYAETVLRNALHENAMQRGVDSKKCETNRVNKTTMDLLEISNNLAKKLGKETLKDSQDIFEALGTIFKEEYKERIKTYTQGVIAARVTANHKIDLDLYNRTLGIDGDPKEHFRKEAIKSMMKSPVSYRVNEKIKELEKEKKIMLFELTEKNEEDNSSVYRSVGINGAGAITANGLITALREIEVRLDEDVVAVNETTSVITIYTERITVAAYQELNEENTSYGIVLIEKMEG